ACGSEVPSDQLLLLAPDSPAAGVLLIKRALELEPILVSCVTFVRGLWAEPGRSVGATAKEAVPSLAAGAVRACACPLASLPASACCESGCRKGRADQSEL